MIAGRDALEVRFADVSAEWRGRDVARPPAWGGYRLVPATFEFWQHGDDRLHDRLRYRRDEDGGWTVERLAP